MNESLNNLLNLIDSPSIAPTSEVKKNKKGAKKVKVDKNITHLVYAENSPTFLIDCGHCKRSLSWKEAAKHGWIYHAKEMKYICTNCV